jgi:hypothetical protein
MFQGLGRPSVAMFGQFQGEEGVFLRGLDHDGLDFRVSDDVAAPFAEPESGRGSACARTLSAMSRHRSNLSSSPGR